MGFAFAPAAAGTCLMVPLMPFVDATEGGGGGIARAVRAGGAGGGAGPGASSTR